MRVPRSRPPRSNWKSKVFSVLLLAMLLFCAGALAWTAFRRIQQPVQKGPEGPMASIVVAAAPIAAGMRVPSQSLRMETRPIDAVPADAIPDVLKVVGRVTARAISAGESITVEMLIGAAEQSEEAQPETTAVTESSSAGSATGDLPPSVASVAPVAPEKPLTMDSGQTAVVEFTFRGAAPAVGKRAGLVLATGPSLRIPIADDLMVEHVDGNIAQVRTSVFRAAFLNEAVHLGAPEFLGADALVNNEIVSDILLLKERLSATGGAHAVAAGDCPGCGNHASASAGPALPEPTPGVSRIWAPGEKEIFVINPDNSIQVVGPNGELSSIDGKPANAKP